MWRATVVALLASAAILVRPVAAQESFALAEVLGRATAYLADYEKKFSAVVSEENYDQRAPATVAGAPVHQVTRADVLMLNLTGDEWTGFRDVFEVNGNPIRDHDERLQKLFIDSRGALLTRAREISDESTRFNIGSVRRTINVPTMALVYLRQQNRLRSEFKLRGDETVDRIRARIVEFSETEKPAIIAGRDGDQLARGRFWIEPASGRILKTELRVGSWTRVQATIDVIYGPNPKVDLWVPIRMTERYDMGRQGVISAQAVYSNFRRFTVDAHAVIK